MNHEKLCNECSNDTLYRNERFDDGITVYGRSNTDIEYLKDSLRLVKSRLITIKRLHY